MSREERFNTLMIKAYNEHRIPCWYVFRPFFEKRNRLLIVELREMLRVAVRLLKQFESKHPDAFDKISAVDKNDIYYPFTGYEKDKEAVSILNRIVEQITGYFIARTMD